MTIVGSLLHGVFTLELGHGVMWYLQIADILTLTYVLGQLIQFQIHIQIGMTGGLKS